MGKHFIDVVINNTYIYGFKKISRLFSEAGTRRIMTLSFIFLIAFFPFTISKEIIIERGRQKDFDRIIWDGDCNKINGVSFMSDQEKICACRKRIKMNGITTNIFGTLYPDDDGFVTCSYNYRESGKYEI